MCQESSQNYLFFFKLSTLHDSNTLDHWLGIKQLHLKCYDKRKNGSLSRRLYCVMNGHHDVAEPLVSAAFSPHLELFLSPFCLLLMLSSLRRHAQPSVQMPPATREPANLRPTQPTPADVPEWTLGWRGHGGRAGRVTQQTDGERKKIGKSLWPWPLCFG